MLEIQTVAFKAILTLLVQTVAFSINSLHWRWKQLLSTITSTPYAQGTTVAFPKIKPLQGSQSDEPI